MRMTGKMRNRKDSSWWRTSDNKHKNREGFAPSDQQEERNLFQQRGNAQKASTVHPVPDRVPGYTQTGARVSNSARVSQVMNQAGTRVFETRKAGLSLFLFFSIYKNST